MAKYISKVKDHLWQNVKRQVLLGVRTLFWKHALLSQTPLNSQFPRIFRLCQLQQGIVAEFGIQEGQISRNLHLRRNPLDFEISELTDLLKALSQVKLDDGVDSLQWLPDNKGRFSVNSYSIVYQQRGSQQQQQQYGLPQLIWDKPDTSKNNFLLMGGEYASTANQGKTMQTLS